MVFRTVETMRIACVTTGMSTTLTTETAHLALHNNGHVKPGPRTAPGESQLSAAQLALWVHVAGAQQESPPLCR